MKTIAELKQRLVNEGFLYIYEWKDSPNTVYPEHAHKGKVTIHILNGSVTFKFFNREITLEAGDCFDVPVGKKHTARVRLLGCHFLVGEMIDGDS